MAPFRLLAKLYDTYDHKLTSEDGADAGEACELLQRCTYGSAVMWNLETPQLAFGGRMVTLTELTRAHFNEHRPHTDVPVFNLNPVVGGRVNWSELLVAPPAGEVWTFSVVVYLLCFGFSFCLRNCVDVLFYDKVLPTSCTYM